MNLVAATAVGVTVWLCFRPSSRALGSDLRRDLGLPRRGVPGRTGRGHPTLRAAVVVAPAAGSIAVLADGTDLALGLILVAATLASARLAARTRRRHLAERRQTQVVEMCQALAGELRAGQPTIRALARVGEEWPDLRPVATAARLGADVPAALRRLAEQDGAEALRAVAGAWQASSGTGAKLSPALDRVVAAVRRDQSTRRLVASELASAQATARTVAALPLFALLLGSGVGGSPWQFLLATPAGLACLAGGLALALLGLSWIEAIALRAVTV